MASFDLLRTAHIRFVRKSHSAGFDRFCSSFTIREDRNSAVAAISLVRALPCPDKKTHAKSHRRC